MKLIGKGTFTKAYLLESGEVLLKSCDPIKECMAHGWFPDSGLFPTLSFENWDTYEPSYKMKYYPKVKSLKASLVPRDYKFYSLLRKLSIGWVARSYDLLGVWRKAFESLPQEFEEEKEALISAIEACANFGQDVLFEISPINVAVDNGRLVLLDCFFLKSKLMEVKSSKSRY